MTAFDRIQLLRACLYGAAALAAAAAVVVLTDEPLSTVFSRTARLSAIAPAAAVMGVWAAVARASVRGELRALEALGSHPLRSRYGAIVGGWLLGLLAVLALVSPLADVRALFPSVTLGASWSFEPGTSQLEAPALGIMVDAAGRVTHLPAQAMSGFPTPGRLTALWIVLPLAVLAPPWAAVQLVAASRAIGAGLTAMAAIVVFHALAVGRVPVIVGAGAAAPLAAQALYAVLRAHRSS